MLHHHSTIRGYSITSVIGHIYRVLHVTMYVTS